MVLNPKIEISENYNTQKFKVKYMSGTFKEVKNYNRILDSIDFTTVSGNNTDVPFQFFREGYYVWVDDELKYIISTAKRIKTDSLLQVEVSAVSLTYILQKIVLPNRSITQPIHAGSVMKTSKVEIDKLLETYFSQYRGYTNYENNLQNTVQVVDEFIWTEPTLYEAICDIIEDLNLVPYVWFRKADSKFIIDYKDVNQFNGFFDMEEFSTRIEEHAILEGNPQRMINIIQNNMSAGAISERFIYPKSDIGVIDDADEQTFIPTVYPINRLLRVYAEANLGFHQVTDGNFIIGGHNAGFYKIDITDFVIEQTAFNGLPLYNGDINRIFNGTADNFRNAYLYYKKDSNNIEGIKLNYRNLLGGIKNFNLNILLSVIGTKHKDKVLVGQGHPGPSPGISYGGYYFSKDDVKHFIFSIEYQTMDSVRYDIVKPNGYGSIIQNQGSAFINFKQYHKYLQDIMSKLGDDEVVAMGRVFNKNDLPVVGNETSNGRLVVQTTYIPMNGQIDFMAIITGASNRIDQEGVINTKKRFTSLISADESIERHEFAEISVSETVFNKLKKTDAFSGSLTPMIQLISHVKGGGLKRVLLHYLVQDLDENTRLITTKTLDNKFAGTRLVDEGATRIVEGVFYVDEIDGETEYISVSFVEIFLNGDNAIRLPEWLLTVTDIQYVGNMFKYKDNRERIAMSILVKKI